MKQVLLYLIQTLSYYGAACKLPVYFWSIPRAPATLAVLPTIGVSAGKRTANGVVAVVASVGVGVVVVVVAVDAGVEYAAGMLLSYGGTTAS